MKKIKNPHMSIASLKSKFDALLHRNGGGSEDNYHYHNPTIIASDLKIIGEIEGVGIIEIEGNLRGIVKSKSVVIREGGMVEGTIIADNLNIKGKFKGEIKAKNIIVLEGAEIRGTVEYESLSVEDGACLDAQFKMIVS